MVVGLGKLRVPWAGCYTAILSKTRCWIHPALLLQICHVIRIEEGMSCSQLLVLLTCLNLDIIIVLTQTGYILSYYSLTQITGMLKDLSKVQIGIPISGEIVSKVWNMIN